MAKRSLPPDEDDVDSSSSSIALTEDEEDEDEREFNDASDILFSHAVLIHGVYLNVTKEVTFVLDNQYSIIARGTKFYWDTAENEIAEIVLEEDRIVPEMVLYIPESLMQPSQLPGALSFEAVNGDEAYIMPNDFKTIERIWNHLYSLVARHDVFVEFQIKRNNRLHYSDGGERLTLYVPETPPLLVEVVGPYDLVEDAEPISAGSYGCTVMQTHMSGKQTLVRVTGDVALNMENVNIQGKLHAKFGAYIPAVTKPDVDFVKNLDIRVRRAIRSTTKCNHFEWLKKDPDTTKVGVSVMEYGQGGDLGTFLKTHPVDYRTCLQLLGFLYSSQAIFGFEHADWKPNNLVLQDKQGLQPQVIDFDFAQCYRFKTIGTAKRRVGSPWMMPPEMLTPNGDKSVFGAVDVWSLGMTMLGWIVNSSSLCYHRGPYVNVIQAELLGMNQTIYQIIHYMLNVCGLPNHYQQSFNRIILPTFKQTQAYTRLTQLSLVEREFFTQILSLDPMERIMHGHLYQYFDMAIFEIIPDKTEILNYIVYRHFDNTKPLPTIFQPAQQLCNLIQMGIVQQDQLVCTECTTQRATHFCTERHRVVCTSCE